mmetsp:Transcript_106627/g.340226  ORF Transcript_106627/g.340226 Transcript_106627/m.340226 type:complete len:322 (-) Transcript_106627:295-1260(-)
MSCSIPSLCSRSACTPPRPAWKAGAFRSSTPARSAASPPAPAATARATTLRLRRLPPRARRCKASARLGGPATGPPAAAAASRTRGMDRRSATATGPTSSIASTSRRRRRRPPAAATTTAQARKWASRGESGTKAAAPATRRPLGCSPRHDPGRGRAPRTSCTTPVAVEVAMRMLPRMATTPHSWTFRTYGLETWRIPLRASGRMWCTRRSRPSTADPGASRADATRAPRPRRRATRSTASRSRRSTGRSAAEGGARANGTTPRRVEGRLGRPSTASASSRCRARPTAEAGAASWRLSRLDFQSPPAMRIAHLRSPCPRSR